MTDRISECVECGSEFQCNHPFCASYCGGCGSAICGSPWIEEKTGLLYHPRVPVVG